MKKKIIITLSLVLFISFVNALDVEVDQGGFKAGIYSAGDFIDYDVNDNTYYKSPTNSIYFEAPSGTPRMAILGSNGNVGIGTATPGAKLEINNGGVANAFKVGNLVMGYGNEFDCVSNGDVLINYRSTGDVILAKGGGNVGIGTDSPGTYKIYVNGQSYFSDDIFGTEEFSVDNDATDVYDDSTSDSPYSRVNADSFHTNGLGVGQMFIEGRAIDSNYPIYIGTGVAGGQPAKDIKIGDNNEIYIDTDVNRVGIGTGSPEASLDVSGDVLIDFMRYDGMNFDVSLDSALATIYCSTLNPPNGYTMVVRQSVVESCTTTCGNDETYKTCLGGFFWNPRGNDGRIFSATCSYASYHKYCCCE